MPDEELPELASKIARAMQEGDSSVDIPEEEVRALMSRHPNRRQLLSSLSVYLSSVTSFVTLTAGGLSVLDFVRREQEADAKKLTQQFRSVLNIGQKPYLIPGDDFSLYPNSNEWKRRGKKQPDPRAEALLQKISMLNISVDSEPGRILDDPDNITRFLASKMAPKSIVVCGSSINNRAAFKMIGNPRSVNCPNKFTSIDGLWGADLTIAQYTPPGTEQETAFDSTGKPFDVWDHKLLIGKEPVKSPYESTMRQTNQPICYFTITKLTSPIIGDDSSVIFVTSLHGLGSIALEQLFEDPTSKPVAQFVQEVSTKAQGRGSWQIAARASDFNSRSGRLKVGLVEAYSELIHITTYPKKGRHY